MKKILLGVMLLMFIPPVVLQAEVVVNKKTTQQTPEGADLEAFKYKLATNPDLTDAQRDALLAERMSRPKKGEARSGRNVELAKSSSGMPAAKRKEAPAQKDRPPRNIVQAERPQSEAQNATEKPKASAGGTVQPRNVLVQ